MIRCKHCGLGIHQAEMEPGVVGWTHADGYLFCPPAFGTIAEPEL